MIQAMIMLSACIVILVMFAVFYSLWDILTGRWTERRRKQQELDDQQRFDDY